MKEERKNEKLMRIWTVQMTLVFLFTEKGGGGGGGRGGHRKCSSLGFNLCIFLLYPKPSS